MIEWRGPPSRGSLSGALGSLFLDMMQTQHDCLVSTRKARSCTSRLDKDDLQITKQKLGQSEITE